MKVGLYADNTLPLDVAKFCETLNGLCQVVDFIPGTAPFHLAVDRLHSPTDDSVLSGAVLKEVSGFDQSCFATNVPYDNNHFFDSTGSNTVVSFWGWNALTDLPIPNGFAYFIASILTHVAGIGEAHQHNTGCINDFWWDKSGVDIGMRAAFICRECLAGGPALTCDSSLTPDIESILNAVSIASRANEDLLQARLPRGDDGDDGFDVFLCHNSDDKPMIRKIKGEMQAVSIRTWLDEDQLPPGMPWQPELERVISQIRSACVFVGPSGMGPWQRNETRAFLDAFDAENLPVIPVLLPGVEKAPTLPMFLRQRTWIDLREDYGSNMARLTSFLADGKLGDRVSA